MNPFLHPQDAAKDSQRVVADDIPKQIENLCYLAVSEPWPSNKRDGVRGKFLEGFARVLCAVLMKADLHRTLWVKADLKELALEAGLSRYEAAKNALKDLETHGWLKFTVGTSHTFDMGIIDKRGRPSEITLLPKPHAGRYRLDWIPLLTLDPFSAGRAGNAGWFAMAKVLINFGGTEHPVLGIQDVVNLTGMSYSRVRRLLPKLNRAGMCIKEGSKYWFTSIDLVRDRNYYGDSISQDRLARYYSKVKQLNKYYVGMNDLKFTQRPIDKDIWDKINALIDSQLSPQVTSGQGKDSGQDTIPNQGIRHSDKRSSSAKDL